MLVAEDANVSLVLTCDGMEAKPNFRIDSVSNGAGIQPTMDRVR